MAPIGAAVGLNLGVDKKAASFAPIGLAVDGLSVARGGFVLFERLSFAAGPGDLVEIRGPNGAGKTSLLRVIAGLLRAQAGRIAFEGVADDQLALHLLSHRDGLKPSLTVEAHARFWAGLFEGRGDAVAALAEVGLARVADLPARVLSQGQSRRLALTRLLVAPRPIWLLDEPAAGLDAEGKALLDGMIAAHRARGGLVIAAVHEAFGAAPSRTVAL